VTTTFDKIEGLGNDFIVVDASLTPTLDRHVCDRHRGVGADGVLFVDTKRKSMRVMNADGSTPEMCGNGIRCVMLWLARRGLVSVGETLAIDTDAGLHGCTLLALDGDQACVRVAMRPYSMDPEAALVKSETPLLDADFRVDDSRRVIGTYVSMGNPHFVMFDAAAQKADTVAPAIERHPSFPSHVNVGLAEVLGPRSISLRVFERGVGYTEACGTGACAAAAAAVETGRMMRGEPIEVRVPGGTLEIVVGDRGTPVLMTGPARYVFRGELGSSV
jgi:diaminopimelate epimerase